MAGWLRAPAWNAKECFASHRLDDMVAHLLGLGFGVSTIGTPEFTDKIVELKPILEIWLKSGRKGRLWP